jgi:hypothetical protein
MAAEIIPFQIKLSRELPKGYKGHCVYVIASDQNDLVKIGYTSDDLARVKALRTGNPARLRIIRLVPGGQKVERDFHVEFAQSRTHGEWFKFHPDMMTFQSKASQRQREKLQPGLDAGVVEIIGGFGRLEDIDKIRAFGAYSKATLEEQQSLLTMAIIGHVQKSIACISELRGISLAEATDALVRLVPLINEHSDAPDERVFPRPNTQVGFLFGEAPQGAA